RGSRCGSGRQRCKNIFRFDSRNVRGGNLQLASGQLQPVLVSKELITTHVQSQAVTKHDVFRAQRRRNEHAECEQECCTFHKQGAASRNANCSMAAATPFSSFVPVSCQP